MFAALNTAVDSTVSAPAVAYPVTPQQSVVRQEIEIDDVLLGDGTTPVLKHIFTMERRAGR